MAATFTSTVRVVALSDRYGGRRAFVRHVYWAAAARFRLLDLYFTSDFRGIERFVFVCKGNICRSPYAEARARSLGLPSLSAGLEADPGRPANQDFAAAALSLGVDLSAHRARSVNELALTPNDALITFEPGQARALRDRPWRGSGPARVLLLGLFCSPARPYLHDPYGASAPYARACAGRIDEALTELRRRVSE
jgi:protein-tyrosine phosphatase